LFYTLFVAMEHSQDGWNWKPMCARAIKQCKPTAEMLTGCYQILLIGEIYKWTVLSFWKHRKVEALFSLGCRPRRGDSWFVCSHNPRHQLKNFCLSL
jgi:hypothetical protein